HPARWRGPTSPLQGEVVTSSLPATFGLTPQRRPTMPIGRVFLGFVAAAILVLAASASSQAQAPSTLLIRGATIIDGLADPPIRGRSLLIEENIIRGLPPADAPAPAGAQVLDLAGKFIIPGLFDSHVHWDAFMGELLVNHGVTSILALDNVHKALRARSQDAHDIPRLFHSGPRPQFTPNS